uniref:Uncharacterized protein n=1 Tax=Oryctolagus cuniculus TaxID=9986 RepID=G1U4T0_RABIT
MWRLRLLLLWALMLGRSLGRSTQAPSDYDETENPTGDEGLSPSSTPPAASLVSRASMTATRCGCPTALSSCCWAGCPPGSCRASTDWCWWWGCPPTGWRCGCWPRACPACPPPCCS